MEPKKTRQRKPKKRVIYTHIPPKDEHKFQTMCHNELHAKYLVVHGKAFSIPNGAKTPGRKVENKFGVEKRVSIEAIKLIREGLLKGTADYFISISRKGFHGLYIEFKFGDNVQSEAQKTFEKNVTEEGYKYAVIWDNRKEINGVVNPLHSFLSLIDWYLG